MEAAPDLGSGITRHRLAAIDMALLASVLLTPDAVLWAIDKNLDALATRSDGVFGDRESITHIFQIGSKVGKCFRPAALRETLRRLRFAATFADRCRHG